MRKGRLVLSFAMSGALALGACGAPAASSSSSSASSSSATSETTEQTQTSSIANPFTEVKSLAELAEVAGFEISFPDRVEGFGEPGYLSAIPRVLAQASYGNGEPSVLVRKGHSDGTGDISGMYVNYGKEITVDLDGVEVKLSGAEDGFLRALWSRDGFDFSVTTSDFLSQDDLLAIVEQVR